MGIITDRLCKIYKNGAKEVRAVDGVSIEIKDGESVAIVGPSGAGKSTLLHLLGGLDVATSGKVLLDGTDIYAVSDDKRAAIRNQKVGFVFQFYHLLPEFTALENVIMPALIRKRQAHGAGRVTDKAHALLAAVGLSGRLDHRPGEMSGGESQRVAIARALVNDPKCLLCDEPTGNLDSKASDMLIELLLDLRRRQGVTLAIVTHDDRIASRMDRTIKIKDGKII